MPVNELDILPPLRHRPLEVIAEGVRTGGHLLEDSSDDGLLPVIAEDVLVKLDEARLAAIVHDDYAFDHI